MKQLFSSTTGEAWGVVEDPLAVEMLTRPEVTRFVVPFLAQDCTAGQAARRLGVRIDTMLYRIGRMMELGLLKQVPPITGRRRRYRTVADRFVVPFETTQFETLVEMVLRHNTAPHHQFARSLVAAIQGEQGGWMVRIHRDGKRSAERYTVDAAPMGQLDWQMSEMLSEDQPAIWYTTHDLRLERADAKALQRDLLDLWQRYRSRSLPTGTTVPYRNHVLHLYLAPVEHPPEPESDR